MTFQWKSIRLSPTQQLRVKQMGDELKMKVQGAEARKKQIKEYQANRLAAAAGEEEREGKWTRGNTGKVGKEGKR